MKRRRSSADISERHTKRQKKHRRVMRARRTVMLLMLLAVCVVAFLFYTPVFNIQDILVTGNSVVSSETIIEKSGISMGTNLFKINISDVRQNIYSIAYLDSVSVRRVIYPPSVRISVTESSPVAYISMPEGKLLIDKNARALEVIADVQEPMPEIKGTGVQKYTLGSKIYIDESDKFDIILLCISEMDKREILGDVNSILVEDINNISFIYDNRLTVKCGSSLDLDRKIMLFRIYSSRLSDNARGTFDMSISGKAVYTP